MVAYASRADRATVEALLKVLDSGQVPENLGADRLTLIPVKNTSAERIAQIMREMYKSQADAFSVEQTTNSLVVMAPTALVEEIGRVVQTLDKAAGSESSRGLKIVPLKKINVNRMQKALDILLRESAPGGRTPR